MRLEFLVPTRGLFGYRNEFLTDTQRRGHHEPRRLTATRPSRARSRAALTGSLVAFETGEAAAYGLGGVQDRGSMFIGPGVAGLRRYDGAASATRNEDMTVNVCKKKQLTNMRAAGSDAAMRLVPPTVLSASSSAWNTSPTTSCWRSRRRACACASASLTTQQECARS